MLFKILISNLLKYFITCLTYSDGDMHILYCRQGGILI